MVQSASIIIPVYNGEKTIRECLESVLKCECVPHIKKEIIVVNNNSTDATAKIVSEFDNVRMVNETVPTSYAARNRGILAAQGDVLAFIDDDCIVSKKWLVSSLKYFTAEDKSLLVSGPIYGKKGNEIQRFFDERSINNTKHFHDGRYFPTANLFVRKQDALAVNGFDYKLISGGDMDFCWKLVANGAELAFSDDAVVKHNLRDSEKDLYLQFYKLGAGNRDIIRNYSANKYANLDFVKKELMDVCSLPHNIKSYTGNAFKSWFLKKIGKPQLFYKLLSSWAQRKGYEKRSEALKKNEIVILSCPDYRSANTYQQDFYYALGKQLPTTVFYENKLRIKTFRKYLSAINVFHLSWLDGIRGRFYKKKTLRRILKLVKVAKQRNVLIIWTMHDFICHDSKDSQQELKNLEKLLPYFDIILYLSEASKKLLVDKMGVAEEKLIFSPHGIFQWPEYKLERQQAEQTFKHYLKIREDDKLILFLGRVRNYKGIVEIALSWNQQQKDNYHLVIAGKTGKECIEPIESLTGKYKNVHIIDRFIETSEIAWMLHSADATLLPYKKILNSGSIIQAIQYNVPVLASNLGAIADLAKNYPGLITTLDDWNQLDEEKIQLAIDNHDPKITSKFIRDHSWEKLIEPLANRLADGFNIKKVENIDISKPIRDFWKEIDLPKILLVGDIPNECKNLNATCLSYLFAGNGNERYINSELQQEYFDAVFLGHIPMESEIKEVNRVLVDGGLFSIHQNTQRMDDLSEYGFTRLGIKNCVQGYMQFYKKSQSLEITFTKNPLTREIVKHQYRIGLGEDVKCDARLSQN